MNAGKNNKISRVKQWLNPPSKETARPPTRLGGGRGTT